MQVTKTFDEASMIVKATTVQSATQPDRGRMNKPRFIFLDLETTGLEAGIDQITEAAWILEDGTEYQFLAEHDRLPSKWVLENTDYVTRILPAEKWPLQQILQALRYDCQTIVGKQPATYLVVACPAFDDRFLRIAYNGDVPYHYHVIDVEAMALGALNLPEPCSLKDLRAMLGIVGKNEAAHTALSDAREVKLIFDAIRLRSASV